MWWVLVLLLVGILFWINCARGMNLSDRVNVALDIVRSSNLSPADGFQNAAKEDPDLVGWMQDGRDCVMLFRTAHGNEIREIVDFTSESFHPGLVIHYTNGKTARAESSDNVDAQIRESADELLRQVRRIVGATHVPSQAESDGFRY